MATDLAPITPSVLEWARLSIGVSPEDAARRAGVTAERLASWESGAAEPTVAKLRQLAQLYQRPLALFFLPEPPVDFDALRDFRRLPGKPDHAWSRPLHKVYWRAVLQQEVTAELREEEESHVLATVPALDLSVDPEEAGGQTESLWSRGLRDTGHTLKSLILVLAFAIGLPAAGVFLWPLAAPAIAFGIVAVVLAFHLLRAPVLQRDELRRALKGAESSDAEAIAIVTGLQAESVHIYGQDFSLADVLLALEDQLAQGWRLGTLSDWPTLRSRLGMAELSEAPDDRGLSPRAVAGRLRIAGVVDLQHLQRGAGPWPWPPGAPASDIASLSPMGVRVIGILRAEGIATE